LQTFCPLARGKTTKERKRKLRLGVCLRKDSSACLLEDLVLHQMSGFFRHISIRNLACGSSEVLRGNLEIVYSHADTGLKNSDFCALKGELIQLSLKYWKRLPGSGHGGKGEGKKRGDAVFGFSNEHAGSVA
jgi:hypothetical protein